MSWRITLDGQNLGSPVEWQSDGYAAQWDNDFFSVSGDGSFTFVDDAYKYIKGLYDTSYCSVIEAKVYICDELFHTGLIFISESVFDLIKCTVNCAVSDNGYLAIIKNKQRQQYFPAVGTSSDQSVIAEAPEILIEFHNVTTGASEGFKRCYRVFDVLNFLVRAMTDDAMTLVSDFFDTGPGANLILVSGSDLSYATYSTATNYLSISYENLWEDLKSLYSLRGAPQGTSIRIEPWGYWRTPVVSESFTDLSELSERVDADKIYATVSVGSNRYIQPTDDTPATSYPNTNLITWESQTYNLRGSCVTENQLNIAVKNIIIDSNSIENALNGNQEYDKYVFLVETDGAATTQFNTLDNGFFYYNQGLNNQNVLSRWRERIHNSVFSDSGGILGSFSASLSVDTVIDLVTLPDYDNVISDPDSAYTPGFSTGLYTLPDTGTYLFQGDYEIQLTWVGLTLPSITLQNLLLLTLIDYELREVTLFNPNTSEFQTSTVNYTWQQTFAVDAFAASTALLYNGVANASITGVSGLWLAATKWGTSGFLLNNAVPIMQNSSFPITPDQFTNIISDITKPISLMDTPGYISRIIFKPFDVSEVEVEFTRND